MEISKNGLNLIAGFEGFRAKPYHCSAGVSTIGYGTTIYPNGTRVTMKDKAISKEYALAIMKYMIDRDYGDAVDRYVKVPLTQNQYDALVSFTYNLGKGAFKSSTLLRKINEGKYNRASKEFIKWVNVNGKRSRGLVRRRKKERDLFLT